MENKLSFCTLFDSNYLSRGLALYNSLMEHCENFHLYIFPFDEKCLEVLTELNLPNTTLIPLSEFEDGELLKVKQGRNRAEYAWTCTSSSILFTIEKFNLQSCTYLDADLFFFDSPQILIDELGSDSVLITEHRYTPIYDQTKKSGIYCVQFITIRNDEHGLKTLRWWRNACLEWCYARVEDGKFGDQKYLDNWTKQFEKIHVLNHLGGGVAPWNVQQYNFKKDNNLIFGIEKKSGKSFPLIFFHFHHLRFYGNDWIQLTGPFLIVKQVVKLIYRPYIIHLEQIKKQLELQFPNYDPHGRFTNYKHSHVNSKNLDQVIKIYIMKIAFAMNKFFNKSRIFSFINPLNLYNVNFFNESK
ncbi:MAG: glycosyl transferase [Candidatus Kapabacteria bacterium]|nr:glycosyl transferase [Candidatus Kapabacteria bacterium]